MSDIKKIREEIQQFLDERDWEKFHTPKNLSMAIAGEAGELLEVFQWRDQEDAADVQENKEVMGQVEDELADILIYCLSLANQLDMDVEAVIKQKLEYNKERFDSETAKDLADRWE